MIADPDPAKSKRVMDALMQMVKLDIAGAKSRLRGAMTSAWQAMTPDKNLIDMENPTMRFICLGYADGSKLAAMPQQELAAGMEACFAYDDELRRGGHFAGGKALQPSNHAVTLRMASGGVAVTDGPYAETKEQLGGILILEARDLEHAVALMSKHPGVRFGPFEIRPANDEINAMIAAHVTKPFSPNNPEAIADKQAFL